MKYRKIDFFDIIDDDGKSFDTVPLLSDNTQEISFVPGCVIRYGGYLYAYLEAEQDTERANTGIILKQTKDGLVAPSSEECKQAGEMFFNIIAKER